MKKEVVTYHCDIEKCEKEASDKLLKLQTIYTTEQTEGRSTEPYFESHTLDLCKEHYKYLKEGHYVFAYGAQGFNHFYFKNYENL